MASIGDGGSGRKTLNPEVNLVPFIDLLSVCICFLLVSAVWLQVGSVQVKQQMGTDAAEAPKELYDLTVTFIEPFAAKVELAKKGVAPTVWEIRSPTKEQFMTDFGTQLDQHMAALGGTPAAASAIAAPNGGVIPSFKDVIASATFVPAKAVPYKSLVIAMDLLRKREVVNLGVMPKAG